MAGSDHMMDDADSQHGALGDDPSFPDDDMRGPSDAEWTLSVKDLQTILAHPAEFGLGRGVWYAIDAPDWLVEAHPAHTLAARLGVSPDRLDELAQAADLYRMVKSVTKTLKAVRADPPALAISIQRPWMRSTRIR